MNEKQTQARRDAQRSVLSANAAANQNEFNRDLFPMESRFDVAETGAGVQSDKAHVMTLGIRRLLRRSSQIAVILLCGLTLLPSKASAVVVGQSLTLAWNACTSTNITGYSVYYGTASGAYTNRVTVGNVTTATLTGLSKGVKYYFAATSKNSSGMESVYSAEVSYQIPNPIVLSLNANRSNNITVSVTVTASGGVPARWGLQASPDLKTWSTIAHGTNVAVNVAVPVAGVPQRYFRLAGE